MLLIKPYYSNTFINRKILDTFINPTGRGLLLVDLCGWDSGLTGEGKLIVDTYGGYAKDMVECRHLVVRMLQSGPFSILYG